MSATACLTRIVATVGPASREQSTLEALLRAGVSIFRLNFSHGDIASHLATLQAIRAAEEATGILAATLADLPGPKIRVAKLPAPWDANGIDLPTGRVVRIGAGDACRGGDTPRLGCTYAGITDDALPGHRLLIDDGAVRLLVIDREVGAEGTELVCTTVRGGVVRSGKGINLPDSSVAADPITDRDIAAIQAAVPAGVDFLGMSFVEDAEGLERLRHIAAGVARAHGREVPPIVAKIERPKAVEHIEAIVEACDAIMVARGDLGVEMDFTKVPILQKRIIAAARAAGKPAIVATQMLQSMVESPIPTRAEASDVANAILDGCDAVMLSGETAVGRWPIAAVEAMVRIAREAEAFQAESPHREPPEALVRARNRVAALGHGASRAARDLRAAAIVAWSQTGVTARLLSRYMFAVPIHAVSTDRAALRRTRILRGVEPVHVASEPASFAEFVAKVEAELLASRLVRRGDLCLLVSGERFGGGPSAIMAVRELGADDEPAPAGGGVL